MSDSELNDEDEIINEAPARREEDEQESVLTSDEKMIAMLSHAGVYFGSFVVPLIIYLIKKDESEYVANHAKESLNFQITMFIYMTISFVLVFVVIGIFLALALGIFMLVVTIIASIKSYEGKEYSYPLCIRFIK